MALVGPALQGAHSHQADPVIFAETLIQQEQLLAVALLVQGVPVQVLAVALLVQGVPVQVLAVALPSRERCSLEEYVQQ